MAHLADHVRLRLKLRALHRFQSTAAAVEDLTAVQEGKIPKTLKQFLTNEVVEKGKGKEILAVADTKLGEQDVLCRPVYTHFNRLTGKAISKKLGIEIYSKATQDELLDLYRGIREQIATLLNGLDPKDLTTMSLGLSHSLSRYELYPLSILLVLTYLDTSSNSHLTKLT
jgi:nucleolar protein 58